MFIDHFVFLTPDLEAGMAGFYDLTGIMPVPGGQHPGRGTHNALVGLGDRCYLELLAPDPSQKGEVARPWMGADAVTETCLTKWAWRTTDLETDLRLMAMLGCPMGEVQPGSRQRTDGNRLTWLLSDPDQYDDALIPFLIDWRDGPHPADFLEVHGWLSKIMITFPKPSGLTWLNLLTAAPVSLSIGAPSIQITLTTVRGDFCFSSTKLL